MNINKKRLGIIGLISIIFVVSISVFIFTFTQMGPYNKNNKEGIVVEIPQGSTTNTISDILYKNKLIKNKVVFKLSVKLSNKAQHFKAGKYLFNQTYSNKDIINCDLSPIELPESPYPSLISIALM